MHELWVYWLVRIIRYPLRRKARGIFRGVCPLKILCIP
jgi:hypothetical protein